MYVHSAVLCCYAFQIGTLDGTMFIITQISWLSFPVWTVDSDRHEPNALFSECFLLLFGGTLFIYQSSRNCGSRVWGAARSITASRYDYKVHNLLLQEERKSWVADGFLEKKKQKKKKLRFLLHSSLEWEKEFKVSSEPESADCFVMEKNSIT